MPKSLMRMHEDAVRLFSPAKTNKNINESHLVDIPSSNSSTAHKQEHEEDLMDLGGEPADLSYTNMSYSGMVATLGETPPLVPTRLAYRDHDQLGLGTPSSMAPSATGKRTTSDQSTNSDVSTMAGTRSTSNLPVTDSLVPDLAKLRIKDKDTTTGDTPSYTFGDEGVWAEEPQVTALYVEVSSSVLEYGLAAHTGHFTIDTGASQHMVADANMLMNVCKLVSPIFITVANKQQVPATGKGSLILGPHVILHDVLVVPAFARNLISVGQMTRKDDLHWVFTEEDATFVRVKDNKVLLSASRLPGGLYMLDGDSIKGTKSEHLSLVAHADLLFSWHRNLNHLNVRDVVSLGKAGRLGNQDLWTRLGNQWMNSFSCAACIEGKGTRLPSPPSAMRAREPNGIVHVDLCGPVTPKSNTGKRYMLMVYDDYTCRMATYFLARKKEAAQHILDYIVMAERKTGIKVKIIRSDGGGEFGSTRFEDSLRQAGIEHITTPPDAHAQNGRVERAHLTIFNSIRTALVDAGLPLTYWAEAARYATYTRNRVPAGPTKSIPEELWRNQKVGHAHLRPFGHHVYVRDHRNKNKLKPRYKHGRFLSYQEGTENYRVLLDDKSVTVSRDVVFLKDGSMNPRDVERFSFKTGSVNPVPTDQLELDVPEYFPQPLATYRLDGYPQPGGAEPEQEAAEDRGGGATEATPQQPMGARTGGDLIDLNAAAEDEQNQPAEQRADTPEPQPRRNPPRVKPAAPVRPPSEKIPGHPGWVWEEIPAEDLNPETVTEAAQQLLFEPMPPVQDQRPGEDLPAEAADTGQGTECLMAHALEASGVPQTYEEAMRMPNAAGWQKAIDDELAKMDKYGVWTAIKRTPEHRVLPGKWVFNLKMDTTTGTPTVPKARWVAKGFRQRKGIDYEEVYSNVVHKDSLRMFFALINFYDLHCDQLDIKAAFLNGDMEEEIFVSPPEGSKYDNDVVLRCDKTLYGLKQSPRRFNKKFDGYLKKVGFNATQTDRCLYWRVCKGNIILLALHVDDQLVAGNCREDMDDFKRKLNLAFECTDGGPVSYFLGISVHRDRKARKLWLSQELYIDSILERFGMKDKAPVSVPLPSNFKPVKPSQEEFDKAKHEDYRAKVGSLLYPSTITRPDIAYAAGLLASYASMWSLNHVHAANHLLRYLKGTRNYALKFDANSTERAALGYVDASWGDCLDTRRSTTGYLFKAWGGAIAWKSKRQTTTALSTAEAEYMGLSDAAKESKWLRQLLGELGIEPERPFPIYSDNEAAVNLSKNPVQHERSKHIDIRYHFVREQQEDGTLQVSRVSSKNNVADIMTKPTTKANQHLVTTVMEESPGAVRGAPQHVAEVAL